MAQSPFGRATFPAPRWGGNNNNKPPNGGGGTGAAERNPGLLREKQKRSETP